MGPLLALAIVIVCFGVANQLKNGSDSTFFTAENARTIAAPTATIVVAALGMTLAFDAGTDQYLTKPFKLPELLSRVRNLLSRTARTNQAPRPAMAPPASTMFDFNSVHVDFAKFEVTVGDKTQSLTTQEMELLRYFIAHEGKVLSRLDILDDVWDHNPDVTTRTIDNFVLRLRRIIETNPAEPRHILSIRGTGYRFLAQPGGESPAAQAEADDRGAKQ